MGDALHAIYPDDGPLGLCLTLLNSIQQTVLNMAGVPGSLLKQN